MKGRKEAVVSQVVVTATHINHDALGVGEQRLQEDPEDIVQEAQRQEYTGDLSAQQVVMLPAMCNTSLTHLTLPT